jgi:nucleoside 2-deoxyribosyltransferase
MIIRGILDKSLSKQTCIRGFARIKELARVSKANPDYQRELIGRQKKVISNFLTDEEYLFFPEVILSVKLKYDLTKKGAVKDASPLTLIESNKAFTSNVDSLRIRPSEKKYSKVFDTSGRDEVKIVELDFNEGELLKLIAGNNHPFHRIDGNHRLSAAEQIDDSRIQVMDIPFCIVLFEELTTEEFNTATQRLEPVTDRSYEKFERVVFFNINSKSEPLTLEQNLKGILGSETYFDNDEIKKIFGAEGLQARKLGFRINIEDFAGIKHLLKDNKWALCLNIFKLYKANKSKCKPIASDKLMDAVYHSLQSINILYAEKESIAKNKSFEMLLAFLFYKTFSEENMFQFFFTKIVTSHLFNANETNAESIIAIFEKLYQKQSIKIFVAMPYYSDPMVNEYNKLFKEALAEVQKKAKSEVMIELIPIMRFKGKSERIDGRLLEKIKECDVFIADLTGCNPNVCFEIAYAEGREKPMIIIKKNTDKKTAPFDMDKLQYIPFQDKTYYSSIKGIINNNLPTILTEQFSVHF